MGLRRDCQVAKRIDSCKRTTLTFLINNFIRTRNMLHADMGYSDIVNSENITFLHDKIEQLKTLSQDESSLETHTIELLVSFIVKHGKDENQIRQISQISKILGESLGLGVKYCKVLEQAARIYDIGNIAIDREVYQKDDALTFEEFNVVKNHTIMGYEILKPYTFASTQMAAIISAEHHEWWDGSGYPRQQYKEEISMPSRIVALADTIGALYRKRPGRKAWRYSDIIEHIQAKNKLQFDPNIIEVFMINKEIIHKVLDEDLEMIAHNWYD